MGACQSSPEVPLQSLHEFSVKVKWKDISYWLVFQHYDIRQTLYNLIWVMLFTKELTFCLLKDAAGKDVDLSTYKGKVLLVVNVASRCALTKDNYTQLSELHGKYKEKGFEILAFPCNQFAHQEPGSNEQIQEFACTRFKAEFPIFDKIHVNGKESAPVYNFLKANTKPGAFGSRISWNFTKFLVDSDGHVTNRYGPRVPPSKIENDIKSLLGL